MAIGTSITPRVYHVDTTGKDYTLDPTPLLRAQERNFASQKETMQMVYETGRKGVEFAEYLGARQQLGRVKAQLSDLSPEDPDFAQRYSSIVMSNPLAFTNPNTAPVAKQAVDPLLKSAASARDQREAMARLATVYGNQTGMVSTRIEGQKELYDYKNAHAPLTDADRLGLNGGAPPLPESQDLTATPTPQSAGTRTNIPVPGFSYGAFSTAQDATDTPGAAQGVIEPDTQNLPTRAPGGGPALLPDITEEPLPAGVKRGNDGALYERKSVGKSSTWVPYKVAPEKPTTALPEGKVWVPELHKGTNDVEGWKAMAAPKLPEQSLSAIEKQAKLIGKTDPEYIALDTAVAEATGAYNKAKIVYDGYSKTTEEGIQDRADIQPHLAQLSETLKQLGKQRDQKAQAIAAKAVEVLYPKFAENKRKYQAAASGTDSVLATPSRVVVPPAAPQATPAPAPAAPTPSTRQVYESNEPAAKKRMASTKLELYDVTPAFEKNILPAWNAATASKDPSSLIQIRPRLVELADMQDKTAIQALTWVDNVLGPTLVSNIAKPVAAPAPETPAVSPFAAGLKSFK